ncbi:MAG: PDZ domain-containing protein, partial [Planctomycetota bacterium]|nr:PDZ domain-containing protein [Planctomycetota bacterium]
YSEVSSKGGSGGKSEGAGSGGQGGAGTVNSKTQAKEQSKDTSKPLAQPETPPVNAKEIQRLVKDLDSDDITVRDKATEELKKIGKPALPFLEESVKSDSPEVAWRSKIIINAIKKAEQNSSGSTDESVSRKIGPTLQQFSNRFSITIRGATPGTKSVAISQDAGGKVSVTITEYDKDGKENTKTYTADSPEEFKQKYPDIAKEYGIGEKQPLSIEIPPFDFDDIWKDFGKSFGKRWEDLQKEMNKLWDMLGRGDKKKPAPKEEPQKSPADSPSALDSSNLGISIEPADSDNGVLVKRVEPNSLGERIGLKEGDVIISINNININTTWECRRLLKTYLGRKEKVTIEITRKGEKQKLVYPR